ncbi:MAG: ImmA/IrrE family metallo-endopeptidase [Candidatus Omnitrophota bacterium]
MKDDDSSLYPDELKNVKSYALALLHKADAVGQLPTPIDHIVKSANLYVNEGFELTTDYKKTFNIIAKIEKFARPNIHGVKKLLGLLHVPSGAILIDRLQHENKKKFIKLHESGHGFMPHQRKIYEIMEDGNLELDHDVDDLFEREANNFAAETLFQLDKYEKIAADYDISIKTPIELSRIFGSSAYASMRRYVQTHFSPIAMGVYNKEENNLKNHRFILRRAPMHSIEFLKNIGKLILPEICTTSDYLGKLMNTARLQTHHQCDMRDANKNNYNCSLQIFNNSYEIFIMIIPVKKTQVIVSNIHLVCI